jgi:hypothetical protein
MKASCVYITIRIIGASRSCHKKSGRVTKVGGVTAVGRVTQFGKVTAQVGRGTKRKRLKEVFN